MGKAAASAPVGATGLRVAVVAARYNETLVEQLVAGALAAWQSAGGAAEALRVERVPGAFELPLAAQALARTGSYDAVVALGCVIRGDTAHFDFVAGECARGMSASPANSLTSSCQGAALSCQRYRACTARRRASARAAVCGLKFPAMPAAD